METMLLYWGLVGKYLVRGVIRNGNGRIDIPEVTVVFSLQGPCMKQLMEQALARGALSWLFSVVSFLFCEEKGWKSGFSLTNQLSHFMMNASFRAWKRED